MMNKIGIICASDAELAPFLHKIENPSISNKVMLKIYEGKIKGVNVVMLFSGVCKVNAAIATQILIDKYDVTAIVNPGSAGGMNEELRILDTVITTEVAYHDVYPEILTEYHPWMATEFFHADEVLLEKVKTAVLEYKNKNRVFFGRTVTGEAFITDIGRTEINVKYHPLSVDMETGSIAHVCYVNKIPFIAIRTITDIAEHSGEDNFVMNCKTASEISRDITLLLLEKIYENNLTERNR